jgi:hypothetical protein
MAIVVLSDTPDMTTEQYDTVMAELGLSLDPPNVGWSCRPDDMFN